MLLTCRLQHKGQHTKLWLGSCLVSFDRLSLTTSSFRSNSTSFFRFSRLRPYEGNMRICKPTCKNNLHHDLSIYCSLQNIRNRALQKAGYTDKMPHFPKPGHIAIKLFFELPEFTETSISHQRAQHLMGNDR